MKRILISIFVLIFTNSIINSQNNEPKILVMGVPQYLFMNGIRIDVDYCYKNKSWIVFSPQYYNYNSSLGNDAFGLSDEYETLSGAGLYISLKRMMSKYSSKGLYIAGGAGYNYFDVFTKNKRVWEEFEPGRYAPVYKDYTVSINKIGINALLGTQFSIFNVVYFDLYIGFGMRYAFRKIPENSFTFFNTSNSDYGYRGTLFVSGFRVGLPIGY